MINTDDRRTAAVAALEAEVGVLIRRARRVIGERARAVHADLSGLSYLMLGYIAAHGPVRASTVGCAFHVDKAAVSRQVQQMLELGLLDRHPDPEDGRATLLTITADGTERMQAVARERRTWLDSRLGEWSPEEMEEFVATLGRYNRLLERDAPE